jgi:hypothetical protein
MNRPNYEEQIIEMNLPDGVAEDIISKIDVFFNSKESKSVFPNGEMECHGCNGEGGGERDHWNPYYEHYTSSVVCDLCEGSGIIQLDDASIQDIERDLRWSGKFNKIIPSGFVDASLVGESFGFKHDTYSWINSGSNFKMNKTVRFPNNIAAAVNRKIDNDKFNSQFGLDCLHFWTFFYGSNIEFIMSFDIGIVREEVIETVRQIIDHIVSNVLNIAEEISLSLAT